MTFEYSDAANPCIVLDSSHVHYAIGPETRMYVYPDEETAREHHPDAIHESDAEEGKPLPQPVIWPVDGGEW